MVERVRVERVGTASTCPLCREPLFPDGEEPLHPCTGCATEYHLACVLELRGCGTLGCVRQGWVPDDVAGGARRFMTDTRRANLTLQGRRVQAFARAVRREGLQRDYSWRTEWRKLAAVGLLAFFALETLFFAPIADWLMHVWPPGVIPFFLLLGQWTLTSPLVLVLWNSTPRGPEAAQDQRERERRRRALWDEVDARVRSELAAAPTASAEPLSTAAESLPTVAAPIAATPTPTEDRS